VLSVIFTPAARGELIEAQDWYESEAAGLGRRFRQTMGDLIERMSDDPGSFPPCSKMSAAPSCAASRTRCFLSSKMKP